MRGAEKWEGAKRKNEKKENKYDRCESKVGKQKNREMRKIPNTLSINLLI